MYIPRDLETQLNAALETPKVLFLLGARQVGKTTLIEQVLQSRKGEMLNMDIEVDRARLLAAASLAPAEAVRSLGGGEVLVIDEAQRVKNIGEIAKGWYDARVPTKIVLLGSSSATLLDIAAAELTGRNEKLWLTPLLFREVVGQQGWAAAGGATGLQKFFGPQLRALLLSRMVYGSYPEAYLASDPQQYLTNLSGDYLLKDIFTGSAVRSPEDVRRLLMEIAKELGESLSVLQLATRLKLSRQTVQKYLDLLEAIFVIFSLPCYCTNTEAEVSKSRKYYFWDTGVKNALQREWVVGESRSDLKQLWENWVLAEILKQSKTFRRQEDLFFWQSRNGSTVQLVVKQGEDLHPFLIAWDKEEAGSGRSFANMYGREAGVIHAENVVEYLM